MIDHLIHEVDEAMRRDRLEQFWRSFGKYVITASVVIIVITVGMVTWQKYKVSQQQDWTTAMLHASKQVEAGEYETAIKTLKLLTEEANDEMAALAGLWLAELQRKVGEEKKFFATLSELKEKAKTPIYEQYITLLKMIAGQVDSQLTPEYFKLTAEEILLASQLTQKSPQAVNTMESLLNDVQITPTMRKRLILLKQYYALQSPETANTQEKEE